MRGKFIVFYGVNNTGKTTQANLLLNRIAELGHKAQYIKYPVYHLAPSGKLLNDYLRSGNPYQLSPREAQLIYAFNRLHFKNELEQILNSGTTVISEDYWGTGVAWGMGHGVEKDFLLQINEIFRCEDAAIFLKGQRYKSGIEKGHLHENNDDLTERVARAHEELAQDFGWKTVDANRSIEEVHNDVWSIIKEIL